MSFCEEKLRKNVASLSSHLQHLVCSGHMLSWALSNCLLHEWIKINKCMASLSEARLSLEDTRLACVLALLCGEALPRHPDPIILLHLCIFIECCRHPPGQLPPHLLIRMEGHKRTLTDHSGLEGKTLVNSLHLGHHIPDSNTCFWQGPENIWSLRISMNYLSFWEDDSVPISSRTVISIWDQVLVSWRLRMHIRQFSQKQSWRPDVQLGMFHGDRRWW